MSLMTTEFDARADVVDHRCASTKISGGEGTWRLEDDHGEDHGEGRRSRSNVVVADLNDW